MNNFMDNKVGEKCKLFIALFVLIIFATFCFGQNDLPDYKNINLSIDKRAEDLVSRMTLKEKVAQMSHLAPAIERLDVNEYGPNFTNPLRDNQWFEDHEIEELKRQRPWENYEYWKQGDCLDGGWWNEALHGLARSGLATSFPQSIGLGSTWHPELIRQMGDVASTEARIHNNVYGKKLTFWSPTINILRDPRWGRNEESYSEDPFLLSRMAVAFVKGMQGNHPRYLKSVATVKHFVANNSEFNRHFGSSDVSERFLREYYLPAFRAAIEEGGAYSVMGAYNAINDVPACANEWLMTDILRKEWGFKGYVVSDCGAISDIVHHHKYETDPEKAVALAVKAGTDLECETCETEQFMYDKYLLDAVKKGYVSEEVITKSVERLFRARFLLGEFDPAEEVPYTKIPRSKLDSEKHRELAHHIARETMVLLKNENKTLPLNRKEIKSIALVGPNADQTILGGYSGTPAIRISPLEGMKNKSGPTVDIKYKEGCKITDRKEVGWDEENDKPIFEKINEEDSIKAAAELAAKTDVAIVVAGTDLSVANEAADREDLELPGNQLKLIKEVYKANPNTIVVLMNGMPMTINWVDEHIPAIVEAWYPGQVGGAAIADVLFGDYNPAGRLPVTFYKSVDQLPPLADYDITKGRTYWFLEKEPLYKFGHGLSYTNFKYSNFHYPKKIQNGKDFEVSVEIRNTGDRDGDEVVQFYVSDLKASQPVAKRKLQGFKRIHLRKGETKTVAFHLTPQNLGMVNQEGQWIVEPGKFLLSIGGRQPDRKENKIGNYNDLSVGQIKVEGDKFIIE